MAPLKRSDLSTIADESQKIRYIFYAATGSAMRSVKKELLTAFDPAEMDSEEKMAVKAKEITEEVLERGEKDNISVILIRTM